MSIEQAVKLSDEAAKKEIEKYGLPSLVHYSLSYKVGITIAEKLEANVNIVKIGTALMDFKLGEAFKAGKLAEHVEMSKNAAKELLAKILDEEALDMVFNCVEGHHGKVPFKYLEAEICANADCYRFIHPLGSLYYLATLGKRGLPHADLLNQSREKLEEKWSVLTLDYCKEELTPYYKALTDMLDAAENYITS